MKVTTVCRKCNTPLSPTPAPNMAGGGGKGEVPAGQEVVMIKVEGVDYTPEGVEALRQELIAMRDESMKQWPEAISVTVTLSHTIAVLAHMVEMLREASHAPRDAGTPS